MSKIWYRCRKCSRITDSYPVGCGIPDCPVKKDFLSDAFYGSIYGIIILVGFFYMLSNIGK